VVDGFTLVLGGDACQELTLGLRDAQAIKGIFNLGGDVFPRLSLLLYRFNIVIDIVEVNPRQVSTPGGHWAFLEERQALEAELAHPIRLTLHFGDLLNDFAIQTLLGLECVIFGYVEPRSICLLFHFKCLSHKNLLLIADYYRIRG